MTAALLTYTSSPTQVAISAAGSTSEVGITFLVVNKSSASVSIEQIVLTLPQGDGSTDLIASGTTFTAGSVHSSNSSSWSLSPTANQAILMPVSAQGFATLAVGDTLQFTLSGLQINAVGAGQSANIAVLESIYNGGDGSTQIPIEKIAPGFYIESFYLDQYNVGANSPVTVTWKVVNALSCSVTAEIIQEASAVVVERNGPGCGIGTANPVCDGTISTGTDFSDSHTCNVQGATVFTLIAQGKGGGGDVTLSSQLLVTVNEPAINFTGFPPVVNLGQNIVVNWVAADAGKLQLYTVPSQGQKSVLDLTATPVGSKTLQPLINTNYFLYAFTNASDTLPAKQSEFDVTVDQPQWTGNLAASNVPTPAYPGDAVTMNWGVLNVDYCDLTCDQTSFVAQNHLPISGPQQVTLPDPGVANATATFTMTPVEFGGLGNFTATTTTVPITNLPHFSQNLGANPGTVAPGGAFTLTWAVDHADSAVINSNLPGFTPINVNPNSGSQSMTFPTTVIPTPITYTITAARNGQQYTSATSIGVQGTGDISVQNCVSPDAGSPDGSYVNGLFFAHPNQRITKVQLQYDDGYGVDGIYVWYNSTGGADYTISPDQSAKAVTRKFPPAEVGDSAVTLTISPGDYLAYATGYFMSFTDDDEETVGLMLYLKLTTLSGNSVEIGVQPSGGQTISASAPAGQQVVALNWAFDYGRMGGIALICCTSDYGQ